MVPPRGRETDNGTTNADIVKKTEQSCLRPDKMERGRRRGITKDIAKRLSAPASFMNEHC